MNIAEKSVVWQQFRFQFPMIICAVWVIISQWELIKSTLKMWWRWKDLRYYPPERRNYVKIFSVFVVAFFLTILANSFWQEELVKKQQQQTEEKLLEEKLITQEELEKKRKEIAENSSRKKKRKFSLEFFDFVFVVILAPIIEECLFRHLIFEIFNKNSFFPYILSGLGFIFFHWKGGLLNFTTISLLIITYLPMTILFIYAYRKGKWNITYPIFFHLLWNLIAFSYGARIFN